MKAGSIRGGTVGWGSVVLATRVARLVQGIRRGRGAGGAPMLRPRVAGEMPAIMPPPPGQLRQRFRRRRRLLPRRQRPQQLPRGAQLDRQTACSALPRRRRRRRRQGQQQPPGRRQRRLATAQALRLTHFTLRSKGPADRREEEGGGRSAGTRAGDRRPPLPPTPPLGSRGLGSVLPPLPPLPRK